MFGDDHEKRQRARTAQNRTEVLFAASGVPDEVLTDSQVDERWMATRPSPDATILALLAIMFGIYDLALGVTGSRWHGAAILVATCFVIWLRLKLLARKCRSMSREEKIEDMRFIREMRNERGYP